MNELPPAKDIAAIIPHYEKSEDSTVIFTNAGEKVSSARRLQTILRYIAYELCLDLRALKKHAASATGKTLLQPLPLSSSLLLIPLKTRIPSIQGQPSIGYVNVYSITKILDAAAAPYRASIELCGGNTLPVIWTSAAIKKQIRYARLSLREVSPQPLTQGRQLRSQELLLLTEKFVEFMSEVVRIKGM